MTEPNPNPEPTSGTARHRAAVSEAPEGTPRRRFRWRMEHYSPEEQADAREQWRAVVPW